MATKYIRQNVAGSYSLTAVPAGVTSFTVKLWGGGGGGASGRSAATTSVRSGGSGGGGGAYNTASFTTSAQTFPITYNVGAGGSGANYSTGADGAGGSAGGTSNFIGDTTISAYGGGGGYKGTTSATGRSGGGGGGTSSVGGTGALGSDSTGGTGDGASGNFNGAGDSAGSGTGGGGSGGGVDPDVVGYSAGSAPLGGGGGGAGGSRDAGNTARTGGVAGVSNSTSNGGGNATGGSDSAYGTAGADGNWTYGGSGGASGSGAPNGSAGKWGGHGGMLGGGGGGGSCSGGNTLTSGKGGNGGVGGVEISWTIPASSNLKDNFNDNSFDTTKWTRSNATQVVETNSEIQITIPSSTIAYHNVTSLYEYDLTGSYVVVKLVDAGNQALASIETYPVELYIDSSNKLFWIIFNGTIRAYKRVSAVNTQVGSNITFDANVHKFFRIREASGTTYWDWSTNGIDWTNHTSASNPIAVTGLFLEMELGCYASEGSATTAKFDGFNYLPTGASYSDGIALASTKHLSIGKVLGSALNVSEAFHRLTGKDLNDSLTLSEAFSKLGDFVRSFSDGIGLSSAIRKLTSLATYISSIDLSEAFSSIRLYIKGFVDGIGFTEAFTKLTGKNLSDGIDVSDALATLRAMVFSELISLTDSATHGITKVLDDFIDLTEEFAKVNIFIVNYVDNLALTDSLNRDGFKQFIDDISLLDFGGKSVNIVLASAIFIREVFVRRKNGLLISWDKTLQKVGAWVDRVKRTGLFTKPYGVRSDAYVKQATKVGSYTKTPVKQETWTKLRSNR